MGPPSGNKDNINEELLAYMSQAFNVSRDSRQSVREEDEESSVESKSSIGSIFSATTLMEQESETQKSSDEESKLLKEGSCVRPVKVFMFFSMLVCAVVGVVATIASIRAKHDDIIDRHSSSYAKDIVNKTNLALQRIIQSTRSLSRRIADEARTGSGFVTITDFEVLAREEREASKISQILYVPIVGTEGVPDWLDYAIANQEWVERSLEYQESRTFAAQQIPEQLHTPFDYVSGHELPAPDQSDLHTPVWQYSPVSPDPSLVNLDLISCGDVWKESFIEVLLGRSGVLSPFQDLSWLLTMGADEFSTLSQITTNPSSMKPEPRHSFILEPVFSDAGTQNESGDIIVTQTVGFVVAVVNWEELFTSILPQEISGVNVRLDDNCGGVAGYRLNGPTAEFLDEAETVTFADESPSAEERLGETIQSLPRNSTRQEGNENSSAIHECKVHMSVFTSTALDSELVPSVNMIPAITIGAMIGSIFLILCLYDCVVTRKQRRLVAVARQTNTLISSLFPKEIQKRIFEANGGQAQVVNAADFDDVLGESSQAKLEGAITEATRRKAIADYFPNATIIFADIVGFTAWSSTRDPSQVFQLLETLFHAFDEIARKRNVFKVETVGDCYVAATGLPEARADHAVIMARFARDCLFHFGVLVRQMEETLGPDTGDLGLRVGLHSGPVTAGVLRGERSRFQLFGDTVNTAARMESNGKPNRVHLSKETAELLIEAGKQKWVSMREDKIIAKGKGELQTYWLETGRSTNSNNGGSGSSQQNLHANSDVSTEDEDASQRHAIEDEAVVKSFSNKMQRLVKWNTELLAKSLQTIIARRIDVGPEDDDDELTSMSEMKALESKSKTTARNGDLVFDEVVEVINLPPPRQRLNPNDLPTDPDMIQLSAEVVSQLHDFVQTIAGMYHERMPFHNFEHASHVTMSTSKLLARIVAPEEATGCFAMKQTLNDESNSLSTREVVDNTYGITSDPLTQFAAVFSALIHDVDHPGVPNTTLVSEKAPVALMYENKSVAEQNSIDLAWDLFMDPVYEDLRRVLYTNKTEFLRFRQLVTNLVMATDIMDKELGAFRKARWNKAFEDVSESCVPSNEPTLAAGRKEVQDNTNRKATIVLEHLIQASDVSHTMQHWHIYIKWNERLFHEMYRAYKDGRAPRDPSLNWYKGEIGFFDFYIIPLAKKLESCGVFGVSSDEYFAYAMKNREEWELHGQDQVRDYIANYKVLYGDSNQNTAKPNIPTPMQGSSMQRGGHGPRTLTSSESVRSVNKVATPSPQPIKSRAIDKVEAPLYQSPKQNVPKEESKATYSVPLLDKSEEASGTLTQYIRPSWEDCSDSEFSVSNMYFD